MERAYPRIYLCHTLNPLPVIKSTIDSIVKLPLQIPSETSVRSKKEETKRITINKSAHKIEAVEQSQDPANDPQPETTGYSKGYIKYPRYDFF